MNKQDIESILADQPNKINIKKLKEIAQQIMPDLVDTIFDKTDTCLCSLTNRKKYKKNFETSYRQIFP